MSNKERLGEGGAPPPPPAPTVPSSSSASSSLSSSSSSSAQEQQERIGQELQEGRGGSTSSSHNNTSIILTTMSSMREFLSSSSSLIGFLPGGFGGICNVMVGHPIDLVKVRMQTAAAAAVDIMKNNSAEGTTTTTTKPTTTTTTTTTTKPTTTTILPPPSTTTIGTTQSSSSLSTIGMLRHILVKEGLISGLYSGVSAPLLAAIPAFAIVFKSYDFASNIQLQQYNNRNSKNNANNTTTNNNNNTRIKQQQQQQQEEEEVAGKSTLVEKSSSQQHSQEPKQQEPSQHQSQQLSILQVAIAGGFTGIPLGLTIGPLERIKCLMQIDGGIKYNNSFIQCVKHIIRTDGISSIFRGTLLTIARDVPGNAAYFATYETIRRLATTTATDEYGNTYIVQQPSMFATFLAGGFAGIGNWIVAIPIDVIKSRWQTATSGQYQSIFHVMTHLIKNDGYGAFFRGIGPALLRAFPANAACLLGVETIRHIIGNKNNNNTNTYDTTTTTNTNITTIHNNTPTTTTTTTTITRKATEAV